MTTTEPPQERPSKATLSPGDDTGKTNFRTMAEEGFTRISNATASNPALSMGARGLLHYLLSKPPTWTPRVADMCKNARVGEKQIRAWVAELRTHGHWIEERVRCSDGTYGRTMIRYFDDSQGASVPQYPDIGSPVPIAFDGVPSDGTPSSGALSNKSVRVRKDVDRKEVEEKEPSISAKCRTLRNWHERAAAAAKLDSDDLRDAGDLIRASTSRPNDLFEEPSQFMDLRNAVGLLRSGTTYLGRSWSDSELQEALGEAQNADELFEALKEAS